MSDDGNQRELVEVMKAAQQVSGATGDGEEIPAFRRTLGLTLPPLAVGRPTATVEGLAGNEESMPARRVAAGHSPPSAVGQPSRLFNGLTFGIAQMFGVLPGGVFQYPDSSGVAR